MPGCDVVVLAAGAINTPAILMRSDNAHHPKGISNGSDQVGRNLMNLQLTFLQLQQRPLRTFPGNQRLLLTRMIQAAGGVLHCLPYDQAIFGLERLASRSVAWWAMTEVRPDPHNKVWLNNEQIRINYIANNREAHTGWCTAGSTPLKRWRTTRSPRWC